MGRILTGSGGAVLHLQVESALLHRANGWLMAEGLLVDVVILQPGIALDGQFKLARPR